MSIKKKYLPESGTCKVTFTLPEDLAETAKKAKLVGEFNDWDPEGLPMRKRSGKFSLTLELPNNREYQFRYLVDGNRWGSDPEADAQASTPYENQQNSIVKI